MMPPADQNRRIVSSSMGAVVPSSASNETMFGLDATEPVEPGEGAAVQPGDPARVPDSAADTSQDGRGGER